MTKFSFDSNIYDAILDEGDEFLDKLVDLINKGIINIYKTHIQDDEHAEMRDTKPEKFAKIDRLKLQLNPNHTTTPIGIWGISKWDECRFCEDVAGVNLSNLSSNPKHGRDALIALSAHEVVDYLVTNDKDLKGQCKKNNITVFDFSEFKEFIQKLSI